jgi:hypothetical protein
MAKSGICPQFTRSIATPRLSLAREFPAGMRSDNPWCYIRVDLTDAGQVLDLIKAAPEAALQKVACCGYFRLAA